MYATLIFLTLIHTLTSCVYGNQENISFNSMSWTNSILELREDTSGRLRVYSSTNIPKDEILVVFGGNIMTKDDVLQLPESLRQNVLQISDIHWIGTGQTIFEVADYINHSCNPNAGMKGQILLLAMRDILPNEEITFDYAMVIAEWVGMEPISCNCGFSLCRKKVFAYDWQLPELQKKYNGYFSHYIQEKINSEH